MVCRIKVLFFALVKGGSILGGADEAVTPQPMRFLMFKLPTSKPES